MVAAKNCYLYPLEGKITNMPPDTGTVVRILTREPPFKTHSECCCSRLRWITQENFEQLINGRESQLWIQSRSLNIILPKIKVCRHAFYEDAMKDRHRYIIGIWQSFRKSKNQYLNHLQFTCTFSSELYLLSERVTISSSGM